MSYRGRHGRGSNRKRDAMPRRWERKQTEREAAREEAVRLAEERLGREPGPGEETEPFAPVPAPVEPPPRGRTRGRARGGAAAHGARAEGISEAHDGAGGTPVGRVLEAVAVASVIASLLLGHRMQADAIAMPLGPARSVAIVASAPAAWLNGLLRVDDGWQSMRTWAAGFMEPAADSAGAAPGPGKSSAPTQTPAATATAPAAGPSGPEEPAASSAKWAAPRVPSDEAPLDIYFCGDSLSMDVGASFLNVSVDVGAIRTKRFWRNATGLSRPDAFDWPAELRREMGATSHEAVIAMFGANDGQSVAHDGKVLQLYTPEWEALYAERVGEAMDILTSKGGRVYWVGLPIPRSESQAKRYAMMNVIYQAEAGKRPRVRYIDSWKLFSSSSGKYSELLKNDSGELVDMRKDDGIHFTIAGANRMASRLLDVVREEWAIPSP